MARPARVRRPHPWRCLEQFRLRSIEVTAAPSPITFDDLGGMGYQVVLPLVERPTVEA